MMKKFLATLLIGNILSVSGKDLKVLMIGNSFSSCVGYYLPKLVAHEKKHSIELTSAYIGGCTLKQHVRNLQDAEQNPNAEFYDMVTWNSKKLNRKKSWKGNVNQLLKNEKYDIITIQQGSPESWDYKFYQPYANELIAYIRKYNPQAEIIIQQTWAYRADSPLFQEWGFDQKTMSDRVISSYQTFAEETGLRIIPMGDAVAIARKSPLYQYKIPAPEQLAAFTAPDLPDSSTDPVGRFFWNKDKTKLLADYIHLNEYGHYLQACVWYAFLFNENAEKITYQAELPDHTCKHLRSFAAESLKKYKICHRNK